MNSPPLVVRLLLLGLLPGIAIILYLSGQHYDPALIDFKSGTEKTVSVPTTPAPADEKSSAAPGTIAIAGFRQIGREQQFTRENLYEHVDGHAEYFISAGFAGLTVTEYTASDSGASQAEYQAEVYDMGKDIQAFGVLTDEAGDNARAVSVGTMAFKTSGGINFIRGRYYVKISAYNPKAPVLAFAKVFSESLPAGRDSFGIFSKLPDLGKTGKTRFVKEGYRGLDFLHNVVEREYLSGNTKITVALLAGSGQEVKALQSSFFDYFKKSGMSYEKTEREGKEFYRVTDKYEGNWFLIPTRDAMFGLFGTEDETLVSSFGKAKNEALR
jgi:hypothetical protein